MDGKNNEAAQFLARAKYLINKIFQHWRRFYQATNTENLEDRYWCQEHIWKNVDCCHNCKEELKLMNCTGDVAFEAKTEYFEDSFQIVENNKTN